MTVEVATFVSQLSQALPPRSDPEAEGADHLRLIKTVLQSTFPNANKAFNLIVTNKTVGNYTVVYPTDMNSVQLIDAAATGRTVTLPTGTIIDGWKIWVTKFDSSTNSVTILGGGNLINGLAGYVLNFQNQIVELLWSQAASAWYAADSSFGLPPTPVSNSGNYTLTSLDNGRFFEANSSLGAFTYTLPTSFVAGYTVTFIKVESSINPVNITPASGNINGAASFSLWGAMDSVRCIWDGATWWALASLQDNANVGNVQMTFMQAPPSNKWIVLDGTNWTRASYPPLFSLWGTNFGTGNGTTTVGRPDIRGYFPRFWNNGSGRDPDAGSRTNRGDGTAGDVVGTTQQDQLLSHTHTSTYTPSGLNAVGGAAPITVNVGAGGTGFTTNPTGGNETRGKNIYMAGYVKALP